MLQGDGVVVYSGTTISINSPLLPFGQVSGSQTLWKQNSFFPGFLGSRGILLQMRAPCQTRFSIIIYFAPNTNKNHHLQFWFKFPRICCNDSRDQAVQFCVVVPNLGIHIHIHRPGKIRRLLTPRRCHKIKMFISQNLLSFFVVFVLPWSRVNAATRWS